MDTRSLALMLLNGGNSSGSAYGAQMQNVLNTALKARQTRASAAAATQQQTQAAHGQATKTTLSPRALQTLRAAGVEVTEKDTPQTALDKIKERKTRVQTPKDAELTPTDISLKEMEYSLTRSEKTRKQLEANGRDGQQAAQFLEDFFKGGTTERTEEIRDRLEGLFLRLKTPTERNLALDSQAQKFAKDKNTSFFTLTGADNTMLRMEYTRAPDGSESSMRVIYSGLDLGGIDMTLKREEAVPADTKAGTPATPATIKADITQREMAGRGRLKKDPMFDDHTVGVV